MIDWIPIKELEPVTLKNIQSILLWSSEHGRPYVAYKNIKFFETIFMISDEPFDINGFKRTFTHFYITNAPEVKNDNRWAVPRSH